MIRKLKIRFIILSMASLFVLLSVIVVGMNLVNYNSVVKEADMILSLLSQNKGAFPEMKPGEHGDGMKMPFSPDMSPELPYETRYFSVLFNGDGGIIHTETSRIAAVDPETAVLYAEEVVEKDKNDGFIENFRYTVTNEGETVRVTFLDCKRNLDSFKRFLLISCIMALAGFAVIFFVIFFFAGKIISPIAESYEKQKRFITDAGHEIKTPLTIINANVDILEMELGKNECLEDIQQQTKRLTSLTNDLVYLARMEESEKSLQMIEFPVSEVVSETAASFKALAQTREKELVCSIQPMLSVKGNDKAIVQLVSVLLDNAVKYSPKGGKIHLQLSKQGRAVCLTVQNETEIPVEQEKLNHVFERFYRIDPSRNSETGGHGIGLSVAKAIVSAHGGKIQAFSGNGSSFRVTVTLPA